MRGFGKKILDFLEVHLAVGVFVLMLTSVSIEVLAGYVLNTPTPKSFELSIYAFVWTIYLGAALAKRYNQHIRFDILYGKLPAKGRIVIDILFDTLTTVVMLVLLIPSIRYTLWNYRIKASALRIPWTYLLVCFPLLVTLIIVHNLPDIHANLRLLVGKTAPRAEVPPWQ